jgi:membrane protease YdiL (CAAX protease family)
MNAQGCLTALILLIIASIVLSASVIVLPFALSMSCRAPAAGFLIVTMATIASIVKLTGRHLAGICQRKGRPIYGLLAAGFFLRRQFSGNVVLVRRSIGKSVSRDLELLRLCAATGRVLSYAPAWPYTQISAMATDPVD